VQAYIAADGSMPWIYPQVFMDNGVFIIMDIGNDTMLSQFLAFEAE
jgi:hypothetical protein